MSSAEAIFHCVIIGFDALNTGITQRKIATALRLRFLKGKASQRRCFIEYKTKLI
jgi:hypothetical protein